MFKSISNDKIGVYASFFEVNKGKRIWRISVKQGNKEKDHFLVEENSVNDVMNRHFSSLSQLQAI